MSTPIEKVVNLPEKNTQREPVPPRVRGSISQNVAEAGKLPNTILPAECASSKISAAVPSKGSKIPKRVSPNKNKLERRRLPEPNYVVRYGKSVRNANGRKSDSDRFWHQMLHMTPVSLMKHFCGMKNFIYLRTSHVDVFLQMQMISEEILKNRKLFDETELRKRAEKLSRGEVSHVDLNTFIHNILDDIFLLKKNTTYSAAIPVKWRRMTFFLGAAFDAEFWGTAENIETYNDKNMLGKGKAGIFGPAKATGDVSMELRVEVRNRVLRLVKLLVCDLIRTVLKSTTHHFEEFDSPLIGTYYYDGEFDVPEFAKKSNSVSISAPHLFPSYRSLPVEHQECDVEDSHWIHESKLGKEVQLTPEYSRKFEAEDLAEKHFPIEIDDEFGDNFKYEE